MEDFLDTRIDVVDGETVGLFGVFDGKLRILRLPLLFSDHYLPLFLLIF